MIIDLLDRYSLRGLSIDNSKNFKLAMPKVFTDKDFDLNLESAYVDIDKHVNKDVPSGEYDPYSGSEYNLGDQIKSSLDIISKPNHEMGYRNTIQRLINLVHMMPEIQINLEQVKEILEKKIKQTDDTSILPDLKKRLDEIRYKIKLMTNASIPYIYMQSHWNGGMSALKVDLEVDTDELCEQPMFF